MKTLLFTALILSLSAFANAAQADHVSSEERTWSEQLMTVIHSGASTLTPVDLSKNTLPSDVRTQLEAISEDQAQIWGDTILEGDYVAEAAVKLEGVEVVQLNSTFMGYRVTYSSVAFDTSDCNPDLDLKACTPGRIVESSFVAPTLKSWIRDTAAFAEFIAD
jgi:hypothetical protein